MANKLKYIFSFLGILIFSFISAQDIPERPNPPRLVNDFAGILNSEENAALEQKLVIFNDSTSTQIAVVIVKSLNGYDKADFAYRIGEKWGVGQKGKNNGAIVLVKPKVGNERGEVFIASGYGLEATLTDALGRRIIENEMIPYFRQNDYYGGISNGVDAIIKVTKGEYKAAANKKDKGGWGQVILIFIVIIFFIRLFGGGKNKNNHTIGRRASSIPWWLLLLGSGSSRGGGWGGSSGGGGGGGGFGGFGGGSFGGGGSGGSW